MRKIGYYTRTYTSLEGGKEPFKNQLTATGIKALKAAGILFILVTINGTIIPMITDDLIRGVVSFISGAWCYYLLIATFIRLIRSAKNHIKMIEEFTDYPVYTNQETDLYILTDEGIYINLYWKKDLKDMHFISWEHIIHGYIKETRYLTYSPHYYSNDESTSRTITQQFEEARLKSGYFKYEPQIIQNDYYSIYFTLKKSSVYSSIPIPPTWHGTDKFDEFINEFKKYRPISPY